MTSSRIITGKAPFPERYEFLFQPARYKVAYGGRGGGRSWAFARALLIAGMERPLRVLCAREFQNSIEDSVLRLLDDQIQLLGLTEHYRVTQRQIQGPGGTLFLFEGLRHNITKIKSKEGVDVVWVEEAEKVSENSWDVLIPTIRKAGSQIWVSFNPDQEDDPTYQRFVIEPPPNSIVVKTSWRDNPWFPKELDAERRHLKRVDPERYAHVWEGECRSHNDAQVLNGKWCVDGFTPVTTGPQAWDGPYYGADWGFAQDPTALVRFWIAPGSEPGLQQLMIEHEAFAVGADLDDTPELFDAVPGAREHLIRADNARPETISHMRNRGFSIVGAPKWKGSVEDGVAWMRSFETVVIHERCNHMTREARLWSYKTDRLTGDVLAHLKDGYEHGWDACRYGAAPMIMNQGSSRQGLIVRRDWWREWPADDPPQCTDVLQFVCTAFDEKDESTYHARTTWGIFSRRERWDEASQAYLKSDDPSDEAYHCILLERWLEPAGFPELREAIRSGVKAYDPDWVFIEDRAAGKSLIEELRRAGMPARAVRKSPDYTADMHFAAIVPEKGRVWHMDRDWASDAISSVTEFPMSEHPGLAHSCSMAWAWMRKRSEIRFADEDDDDDEDADLSARRKPIYG